MNRRSFLKFIPAGVLGAKQAATQTAEKLALASATPALQPTGGYGSPVPDGDYRTYARKRLSQIVSPWWQEARRREIGVSHLDPDLASMQSMSLSVRMQIQRDRNFERNMESERAHYEGVLSGLFD